MCITLFVGSEIFCKFVSYLILKRLHHSKDVGPIKPLTYKKETNRNRTQTVPTKCTVTTQSSKSSNVHSSAESMKRNDAALDPAVMLPLVLIEPGTPNSLRL